MVRIAGYYKYNADETFVRELQLHSTPIPNDLTSPNHEYFPTTKPLRLRTFLQNVGPDSSSLKNII